MLYKLQYVNHLSKKLIFFIGGVINPHILRQKNIRQFCFNALLHLAHILDNG